MQKGTFPLRGVSAPITIVDTLSRRLPLYNGVEVNYRTC